MEGVGVGLLLTCKASSGSIVELPDLGHTTKNQQLRRQKFTWALNTW